MNWYIVQAYSGFEKKVVESIKEELKRHKLEANLDQLLIPTHQVTEVKKGKRTKKEKKYFPGYVLIKIELTKQIYHLIKNLQKVSGFLGSSDKPTPISDSEIKRILGQVSESATNQKTGLNFEIGEKVKVCDGPFASFTGLIEEIDEEKSRLKVSVSIFGRPTPVDLEFTQVEKIDMAKEVTGYVKLQIKGGQANPAPPVGPALGQRGINIMEFCKAFNEKTKSFMGKPVPVVITVYKDKKFDFVIKSPPASHFIREAAKLKSGSSEPGRVVAGSITMKQAEAIAKEKMKDLNAFDLKEATKIICGSARSMGIEVKE